MSESLAEARTRLREQQGEGARYDDDAAPSDLLLAMRLARADVLRALVALDDTALEVRSTAVIVAEPACLARLVAEAFEALVGFNGIEGEDAARSGDLHTELTLAVTLPGRALRSLLQHALQHLDVASRDLDSKGWNRVVVVDQLATTPTDAIASLAQRLESTALSLQQCGRAGPDI